MPVVSDGSLNERMGRTVAFAFCAVAFAHFKISVSLTGRPWLDFDSELSVCVIFLLWKNVNTHGQGNDRSGERQERLMRPLTA